MNKRKRFYVGLILATAQKEVFRSAETPTADTYPQYGAAVGPFHTRAGAEFCAKCTGPDRSSVAICEQAAKRARTNELPVIFRWWQGDVIALFPTLHESIGGHLILGYMHVGQHGATSCSLTQTGRPATPEEYAPLLAELRGIYETAGNPTRLVVVRRRPAMGR